MNSYADNAPSTQLSEVDVIGKLDQARNSIQPSLGATDFNITSDQIDDEAQGNNASFNQVLLRAPGVAEDSFGVLHIRGEHANLQYRINDVLLPEGLTGFGEELNTRFVDNVSLIDGSLPAQYGFHTAGIVDIHTKSGAFTNGGSISMYGGAHSEVNPSFTYGGSAPGGINYFTTGSYLEDNLGIENTTGGTSAIHDQTQQGKMFAYVSKIIDDTSRLNVMLSASHSDFQIPNSPGGTPFADSQGNTLPLPYINSADVNDRQIEQNFYGVVSYQKAEDKLNYQLSAFTRFSEVNYLPDPIGDLEYNGIASKINDSVLTNGLELDGSYELNENHTLRAGSMFTISDAINENNSSVFPTEPSSGALTGGPEESINYHNQKQGEQYGLYLQDEWKVTDKLTLNYGGRFDQSYQYLNEYQFSPRANAVYDVDQATKVHAGYARYFTPPPLELAQNINPAIFDGTTNQAEIDQNLPTKAERSNYYDLGVAHNFSPELQVGWDNYYKAATHQLDDGQFGAAPIITPFNYSKGQVGGSELTINYKKGGFSGYANTAYSHAVGKNWASSQFQFSQVDYNYTANHWVSLDHDQSLTVSSGLTYEFENTGYTPLNNTKVYADILFGSGLRTDSDPGKPDNIPNGKRVGSYNPVNLGVEHTIKINNKNDIKVRFDVVNVFDEVYELRSGSGVGVYAPQYGPRRGFCGGVTYDF